MTRARSILLVGLLAIAGAVACGGGGGGGGGSSQPAGSIKVTMTEFKFDPSAISAKPGKVTLYLVNTGTVSHDMVITGPDGKQIARSDLVQPGDSALLTVDNLAAGTYPYLCDQPGHADAGMKGTLTVG